jgi:hypothetical protein
MHDRPSPRRPIRSQASFRSGILGQKGAIGQTITSMYCLGTRHRHSANQPAQIFLDIYL